MQNTLILRLNSQMASSAFLLKITPLLADIFVFSYPIFLLRLYFSPDKQLPPLWERSRTKSAYPSNKLQALSIFWWFIAVVICNYIVKFFVSQSRPLHVLDNLTFNPQSSLILDHIPTDAFPSDHAAVSLVIALMVLLISHKHNNTKIKIFWQLFLVFALIMDISRMTMWLHWPVDILAWSAIAIAVAYFLTWTPVEKFLMTRIYSPLIRIQEWLSKKIKLG